MKIDKVFLVVSILISTTISVAQSFTHFPLSVGNKWFFACLLYTSDAADERSSVDLGGRRIIKKKNN